MNPQTTSTTAHDHDESNTFNTLHSADLAQHLQAARVILRMVSLALSAQIDQATSHPDSVGASRWSPAVDEVVGHLNAVRDLVMETRNAPALNWPAPLALASALGAALEFSLWSDGTGQDSALTLTEAKSAIEVVLGSLVSLHAQALVHGRDVGIVTH